LGLQEFRNQTETLESCTKIRKLSSSNLKLISVIKNEEFKTDMMIDKIFRGNYSKIDIIMKTNIQNYIIKE